MTQGAFIEHLLYNECEIDREIVGEVYRIKKRLNPKITAVMTHWDRGKKMKAMTICQICHALEIPIPDEVSHVEETLKKIKDNLNSIDKNINPN